MSFSIALSHFFHLFKWKLVPFVYVIAFLTELFIRWCKGKYVDA